MRLLDWKLLKLGIGAGVVLGLGVTVGVELVEMARLVKMWQVMEEVLGFGLGVVFTVANLREIKSWTIYQIINRYGNFLVTVLLAWGLWLVMMVALNGEGNELELMGQSLRVEVGMTFGVIVSYVIEAVKLIVLGLVPVMGYWWLNSKSKYRNSKQ